MTVPFKPEFFNIFFVGYIFAMPTEAGAACITAIILHLVELDEIHSLALVSQISYMPQPSASANN